MIVRARGSRIRNAESRSWRVVARPGERILWIFREHAIVDISVSMVCIECETPALFQGTNHRLFLLILCM
jgi:hypothetical protein